MPDDEDRFNKEEYTEGEDLSDDDLDEEKEVLFDEDDLFEDDEDDLFEDDEDDEDDWEEDRDDDSDSSEVLFDSEE